MASETRLPSACFFCYGLAHAVPRVLLWMAVEDIMSGTLIESSLPLLLFSIAEVLFRVVATLIASKVSFLALAVLVGLVDVLAYVLLVVVDQVQLRVAGAFVSGARNGLSVVLGLFLVARFPKIEESISAIQVGSNVMTPLLAFCYAGSTIWFCLPPRWTVAIGYTFTVLLYVVYAILNHGPLKKYQVKVSRQDTGNSHTDYQHTDYQPISANEKITSKRRHLFWIEKVQFLYDIFPLFGYSFLNYLSFYLAESAVLTTVSFPSSPFRIRDHYHYYRLSSDVGMLLGGSEVLVISCLCPQWLDVFHIKKIWLLVLINVSHLIFFLCASWYHFVPNVYILQTLCVTNGAVFGLQSVHILITAANKFQNVHDKGVALAAVELGFAVGRLASGLLGIFVEDYLRKHCTGNLLMGQYCLARFAESLGWNENLQCR